MDETNAGTSADAPRSPAGDGSAAAVGSEEAAATDTAARPRRRWLLPTALVPVVVLLVLIIGWAVDTSAGGVARNVHLAGVDVSHLSQTQLATKVATLAKAYASVPVDIVAQPAAPGDQPRTYHTTAGEIGLMIDQDRTVQRALGVGDEALFLLRPLSWARSLVSERDAPVEFQVSVDQVATAIVALEGKDLVPAAERGIGVDAAALAAALPNAARLRGTGPGAVRVEVRQIAGARCQPAGGAGCR